MRRGIKKTVQCLLLFLATALIFSPSAMGQEVYGKAAKLDGLRQIEVGKALVQMPERGVKPEDFVPPHWAITSRAEGDLNADNIRDFAFIMMPDEKDAAYLDSLKQLDEDDSWVDGVFIIAVADSRGDRKMHLNAVNYELLGNSGAVARHVDARDDFKLAFKKNVLDVMVSYGGTQRTDATFHFRMDPPTGGFLTLIGFDVDNNCIGCDDPARKGRISENYLSNMRVETTYKINNGEYTGTDKQTPIAAIKIDFTNARLNDSNQKGWIRPF